MGRLARAEEKSSKKDCYRGNTDSFLRAWRREKEVDKEGLLCSTTGLATTSDIACFPDVSRSGSRQPPTPRPSSQGFSPQASPSLPLTLRLTPSPPLLPLPSTSSLSRSTSSPLLLLPPT